MNDKTPANLTEKQTRSIPLILSCPTLAEGCRKAGISRETFYTWRKNETFLNEWRRQSKALVDEAFSALKATSGEAVNVLRRLLKSKSATVRLRAAQAVLEYTSKMTRDEEIVQRLEELERRLGQ